MKKQYLIYADESHKKGKYYSNFYGGALIDYANLKKLNKKTPSFLQNLLR